MSKFLTTSLSKIEAYVPGEQPQDKKYIKLNTNESPYPVSAGVVKAVGKAEIESLRLYCDPTCKDLKEQVARVYNVKSENVFVSNGSDEILNFAFMSYGQNGVVFADITYGFYSVFADLYGLNSTIIPLKEDFNLDVEKFCNQNKLVVIASPNAPTGIELSKAEVVKILETNKDSVVIIDQAYVDFGGTSFTELTKAYKNLLCVQTFSKSRSMAGARLGFAIADKEIIEDLEKVKYSTNPYNVNKLTQLAGVAALKDNGYYMDNAQKIVQIREWTTKELINLGFFVLPSKANFIFAKTDKLGGKDLYLKLKEKGVLVRHFEKQRIKDFNRITIGSSEEMEIFIKTVKDILREI